MKYEHEFEDEDGNEIARLEEITYEVLKTYVEPEVQYNVFFGEGDPRNMGDEVIVFTHVVRIRPEAIDTAWMFDEHNPEPLPGVSPVSPARRIQKEGE
jgi:hypothetical protein